MRGNTLHLQIQRNGCYITLTQTLAYVFVRDEGPIKYSLRVRWVYSPTVLIVTIQTEFRERCLDS